MTPTTRDLATIASDVLASGHRLGDYQYRLLRVLSSGRLPRWSGADLKGKASKYSASYARARAKVIALLDAEARRAGHNGVIRRAAHEDGLRGRIVVELA